MRTNRFPNSVKHKTTDTQIINLARQTQLWYTTNFNCYWARNSELFRSTLSTRVPKHEYKKYNLALLCEQGGQTVQGQEFKCLDLLNVLSNAYIMMTSHTNISWCIYHDFIIIKGTCYHSGTCFPIITPTRLNRTSLSVLPATASFPIIMVFEVYFMLTYIGWTHSYKVDMAKLQSQLQRNPLRSSYVQYVLGYLVTSVSIVSQVRYSGTWLVKASELTAKFGS